MRLSLSSCACLSVFLQVACVVDGGPQKNQGTGSGGTSSGGSNGVDATGGAGTGNGTGNAPGTGGTVGSGGGANASGGTDPGGTGGNDPGGTGGTTGSGVGCAGADLFCEDFESIADGQLPTGGDWIARDASCGQQNFSMGVSGERPRGASSKALKVTNHSYASCRLASSFPASDDFWVRAFIYWEPEVGFDNKEILAIDLLPPDGVNKDDPAVRFGDRSKDPCVATPGPQVTMIGVGGGEVTGCDASVSTPKGEWHCFEAHVRQSGNLLVNTYINGTALTYESVGKPVVDTLDLGQAPTEKVNHIRLGMFTHDSTGQGNVYIDDVGVSTTRLGCGD